MENKSHLPIYGVGPVYAGVIIILTTAGIGLTVAGRVPAAEAGSLQLPLAALGILFIVFGAGLWYSAVFRAKVDDHIKRNTLVTAGVYAWVRNPIYSAFLMVCTGTLLLADNLWLLILPLVYWAYLTILIKYTEEKWLVKRYGREYLDYCGRVNRCIPWPPKK